MQDWQWRKVGKVVLLVALVAALVWQCAYGAVTLTDGPHVLYRSGRPQPDIYDTYAQCRDAIAVRAPRESKTRGIITWACRQNVVAEYSACPSRPADVSREINCPAGTTGTWTQTQGWISDPSLAACWRAIAWVPPAPLATACPPIVVADTTPPTPATTITCVGTSTTQIACIWGPADDNVGVTGSTVEACTGASCASFSELWRGGGPRQHLHTVPAGSTWSYRVRALDAAGNISAPSPIATGTTLPITPPPTSEWSHCANQGQLCAFTGTRRVRYGINATWTERELAATNGGAMCDNVVFGNPASGLTKTCQLADTVTPPPPPPAGTGTASLSWTAPTRNTDGSTITDLAGYRINYGTGPNVLSATIQIPAITSHVVTGLAPGNWFFGVRAYNSQGQESESSNVVQKAVQ